MANGLDERRALAHAAEIRALDDELEGITLLAGIECDIRPDGTMDLADDCLAQLDLVVASVHSALTQEPERMTDGVLRALECPYVDVLGHPTGRMLLRREPRASTSRPSSIRRHGSAWRSRSTASRTDAICTTGMPDSPVTAAPRSSSRATPTRRPASNTCIGPPSRLAGRGSRLRDVLTCLPLEELRASLRRHRSRQA